MRLFNGNAQLPDSKITKLLCEVGKGIPVFLKNLFKQIFHFKGNQEQ